MLTGYILLLAGVVALEVRLIAGQSPAHFSRALALMWLESMLLLSITFRAGTSLSTLATGVLVFGMHILAFLGGWVKEFRWIARSGKGPRSICRVRSTAASRVARSA